MRAGAIKAGEFYLCYDYTGWHKVKVLEVGVRRSPNSNYGAHTYSRVLEFHSGGKTHECRVHNSKIIRLWTDNDEQRELNKAQAKEAELQLSGQLECLGIKAMADSFLYEGELVRLYLDMEGAKKLTELLERVEA